MAEDTGQTRTEEPTPRRREEARQRGQIAFSAELTAALVVMAGTVFLALLGEATGARLLDIVRTDLSRLWHRDLDIAAAQAFGMQTYERLLGVLGLFFVLLVLTGAGACLAQVGFHVLPERLLPDLERIAPTLGFGRLFSGQSGMRIVLALLKVLALGAVALIVIRGRGGEITVLAEGDLSRAVGSGWALCLRVMCYLAGVLLILGIVDYVVQWRRNESALRMTRQELKEEIKREEGDPIIRNRIRQLQRERARQRMLATVPRATVVITNPTHVAVALRYERDTNAAPVLLAKGAGVLARQIAQLARRHGIPVMERPVVARAIYAAVREGQEIPPELFRAVAEVIAFVFRLRGAA